MSAIPISYLISVPIGERPLASAIIRGLRGMDSYVSDFGAAVTLFEYSNSSRIDLLKGSSLIQPVGPSTLSMLDSQNLYSSWMMVAARDGAMSIYHFIKAMEGVKHCIHKAPTIEACFDRSVSRLATKLFNSHFPNWNEIRHAVAHAAELSETPEKLKSNSFSKELSLDGVHINKGGDGTGCVFISNGLINNSFSTTINGKLLQYEVSSQMHLALTEVRDQFFSAFSTKR